MDSPKFGEPRLNIFGVPRYFLSITLVQKKTKNKRKFAFSFCPLKMCVIILQFFRKSYEISNLSCADKYLWRSSLLRVSVTKQKRSRGNFSLDFSLFISTQLLQLIPRYPMGNIEFPACLTEFFCETLYQVLYPEQIFSRVAKKYPIFFHLV